MPRYFFNVHDGKDFLDETGTELADLSEARKHAIRCAGELLQIAETDFWNASDWKMQVTNEVGLILFSLHFMGIDAPAARAVS